MPTLCHDRRTFQAISVGYQIIFSMKGYKMGLIRRFCFWIVIEAHWRGWATAFAFCRLQVGSCWFWIFGYTSIVRTIRHFLVIDETQKKSGPMFIVST